MYCIIQLCILIDISIDGHKCISHLPIMCYLSCRRNATSIYMESMYTCIYKGSLTNDNPEIRTSCGHSSNWRRESH